MKVWAYIYKINLQKPKTTKHTTQINKTTNKQTNKYNTHTYNKSSKNFGVFRWN